MRAGLAKDAGIEVRVDISDDFPPLRTDQRRLEQVLVNIVTNALKFTPSGGSVTVKGRYDAVKGPALLVISYTGVGIAQEDITVSLAPYGPVGLRNTRKKKGTGIGLPLPKHLVE